MIVDDHDGPAPIVRFKNDYKIYNLTPELALTKIKKNQEPDGLASPLSEIATEPEQFNVNNPLLGASLNEILRTNNLYNNIRPLRTK